MNFGVVLLLILSALLLLWLVFIFAPAYLMYLMIFGKGKCRPHELVDLSGTYYGEYQDGIRANIKKLKGRLTGEASIVARDGTRLCAELAEHGHKKTAILVHGYHSSPTNNFYDYGNLLYENGYDLVLLHQRSHGKSEGKHSTFGLCERYDLLDWLDWSRKRYPENDMLIVGVSMGATTVGLALDKINDPKIKAAVLDCGFTSPREQMTFDCRRRRIPRVVLPIIYQLVKLNIKQDINESTVESLSKADVPILFVHGTEDEAVPCEFTNRNYQASASVDKELLLIDGANHTLAMTVGGDIAAQKVVDFLKKHF